jgi:hypothetical protein
MKRDSRPGGMDPAEMREILSVWPMPAAWRAAEVDVNPLPVFDGKSLDECITAFREANAARQKNKWVLGGAASRVTRGVGGRPKRQDDDRNPRKADTQIQRFCKKVGISRNTFQRLTLTYTVFAETRSELGTSFRHVLSFGHHEIAARLTDSPEEAVNADAWAYRAKWTASMLEEMLTLTSFRPKPHPMNRWFANRNPTKAMKKFLEHFFRKLEQTIDLWPVSMRRQVPNLLWQLAKHVESTLPQADADLPPVLRDLVIPDLSDPISAADAEVM